MRAAGCRRGSGRADAGQHSGGAEAGDHRIMCGRFSRTSSRDVIANEFGVSRFVNVDLPPALQHRAESARRGRSSVTQRRSGSGQCGGGSRRRPQRHRRQSTPVPRRSPPRHCSVMPFAATAASSLPTASTSGARTGSARFHISFTCARDDRSGLPASGRGTVTAAGARMATCAIVTCPPNELMAPIHNRMPVILPAARARPLAGAARRGRGAAGDAGTAAVRGNGSIRGVDAGELAEERFRGMCAAGEWWG